MPTLYTFARPFILALILLMLSGCDEKNQGHTPLHTADTPTQQPAHNWAKQAEANRSEPTKTDNGTRSDKGYTLSNDRNDTRTISVVNGQVGISESNATVTLLYFFTPDSQACRAEAAYFPDLKKRFRETLEIIGIVLHPTKYETALSAFVEDVNASFFISDAATNMPFAEKVFERFSFDSAYPVPITILYRNGEFYRYYEGAVPVEMLEHDINAITK